MTRKIKAKVRIRPYLKRVRTRRGVRRRVIKGHQRTVAKNFGSRPPTLAEKEQLRQELMKAKVRWKKAVGVEESEEALEDITRLRNKLLFDEKGPHRNLGAQPQVREIRDVIRDIRVDEKIDRSKQRQREQEQAALLRTMGITSVTPRTSKTALDVDPQLARREFLKGVVKETQKSNREAAEAIRRKLGLN